MSSNVILQAQIYKVFYVYHLNGSIEPYIELFPELVLDNGKRFRRIKATRLSNYASLSLAPGDKITVTVPENGEVTLEIVTPSENPRQPLQPRVCPICGAPLLADPSGVGRCVNRSCGAQMTPTIFNFLRSIGIEPHTPLFKVMSHALTAGHVRSISDIFSIAKDHLNQYTTLNVIPLCVRDVNEFAEYIRAVENLTKSSVHIDQFLNGMRIPGWNRDDVALLSKHLERISNSTEACLSLFKPGFFVNTEGECDHMEAGWREFCSVDANVYEFKQLASMLR